MTEKLEALYYKGMDSWGKAHKSEIDVAMTSTGLKLSQIKVSCQCATSYWPSVTLELPLGIFSRGEYILGRKVTPEQTS